MSLITGGEQNAGMLKRRRRARENGWKWIYVFLVNWTTPLHYVYFIERSRRSIFVELFIVCVFIIM